MQAMEAREWVKFEERYTKYGIDLNPPKKNDPRVKKRKRVIKNSRRIEDAKFNKLLMTAVFVAGLLAIISVSIIAFCANIKFDINAIEAENRELQHEIENLEVEIITAQSAFMSENNIKNNKLISPEEKSVVRIKNGDTVPEGFKGVLREKAYQ